MEQLSSRMKDFFDIWLLATTSQFGGTELQSAIMATFERRGTNALLDPVALSNEFSLDPEKQLQWRAFARRIRPGPAPEDFSEIICLLRAFLKPICEAIESSKSFRLEWNYPSGWKSA